MRKYLKPSTIFRSSHQKCSMKKGALRNFTKFTRKHLCQSLFFYNKVARVRSATLLKRRLWHNCFPLNFAKFRRTPLSQNTSWRLLLYFHKRSILIVWLGSKYALRGLCIGCSTRGTSHCSCSWLFNNNWLAKLSPIN